MRALADSNAEHFPFASRSWLSARERSSLAETTLARYDSTAAFLSAISIFLLEAVHELATRRVRLGELSLEGRPEKSWGFSAGEGGWRWGGGGKGRGVAGRRARSRASGGAGGKARA